MSAVPLTSPTTYPQGHIESRNQAAETPDWMRIGVGSTLFAGALLLVTGRRKAGLVVTLAGTALAMLENRELVAEWWEKLPGQLQKAQQMLDQAQSTVDDLSAKRESLRQLFGR